MPHAALLPQERIVHFIVREHGAGEYDPKAALLAFLQQEYEVSWHMAPVLG